jgi:metal-dependent amidase/aminoacylase/carboxypeptidase family protein
METGSIPPPVLGEPFETLAPGLIELRRDLHRHPELAFAEHRTAGIVTASEDFASVAERIPTGFIAVGAGGPGCGAHHAPDFDIDERAIALTAEILTRAALTRLGGA